MSAVWRSRDSECCMEVWDSECWLRSRILSVDWGQR